MKGAIPCHLPFAMVVTKPHLPCIAPIRRLQPPYLWAPHFQGMCALSTVTLCRSREVRRSLCQVPCPATACMISSSPSIVYDEPLLAFSTRARTAAVEDCNAPLGSMDTVLCLSTTKWIHLNFGDEGLRRLFARVHECLRPGGSFVLEPQPWSSYRKRATLTPAIAREYRQIALRPHQFVECLLGEFGFRSVEQVAVPYDDAHSSGFKRRPLFIFTK